MVDFQKLKKAVLYAAANSQFYRDRLRGFDPRELRGLDDFTRLPFSDKYDLRHAYPLGLLAAPPEEIVRVHSSSGTTGQAVIIPYTRQDVEDWATMFARCFALAGVTRADRVQITPGYGLWTAGIGFQAGCEKLGAMAVPTGPGNTEKQLQLMLDLQSTVICATASYALLLAEEVQKRGLADKINLKRGVIGSERWGELMRRRIAEQLRIELFDIYGLTEIYGPGIAIDCPSHTGMHYWDDFIYCEVIDPATGKVLPEGETGEIVVTTLRKEGAPLLRYRTHDISRLIPGQCPCGRSYPRLDRIVGRTDDMIKVKGVNIYPGQIEDILRQTPGLSSEYLIVIDYDENGKERLSMRAECAAPDRAAVSRAVEQIFRAKIGLRIRCECVGLGELPRSEKKTRRVFDKRAE
ncbi:MAG: phenylacetate--CoA ligase [Gracilibacteraceae bacterium]|jgi:phenylacetate-CoA ligase|nr:phenylacetate--CoA ligase [Gracilibacteraceae bacterium]